MDILEYVKLPSLPAVLRKFAAKQWGQRLCDIQSILQPILDMQPY